MGFPVSYLAAKQTGDNLGAATRELKAERTYRQDQNTIERILTDSINSGDPQVVQNNIGKILSQVSPERQGAAVEYLQNVYKGIEEKRLADKKRTATQNAGLDPDLDPQLQKLQFQNQLADQSAFGILGQASPNQMMGGLTMGGDNAPQEQQTQPAQFNLKDATDDQLVQLTRIPKYAPSAKAELHLREKERDNLRADNRELKKETLKRRDEISSRASVARQAITEQEDLLNLIGTGNIDDPTVATILDNIPMNLGRRFLSPETTEYKAGLVNGYRALRNIFQGQTRVKEIELLEDKIADIYLTDEQKKGILRSSIKTLNVDLLREEVAAEIEEQFPNLGLLQFNKKVEEKLKPRLNALADRVIDEQKALIQDAENRKKIPLDYDDPEGRQILEQLVKEAKGDQKKTRELAKKKGYIIGK